MNQSGNNNYHPETLDTMKEDASICPRQLWLPLIISCSSRPMTDSVYGPVYV